MDYHRFMGQVQHRARLATFEQAVSDAGNMETLAQRACTEARHDNLA